MARTTAKADLRDETKLLVELTELWHERGLHLPTRTVYVGSETVDESSGGSGVDDRLAERVLKNVRVLETVSDEPITLLIHNLGGEEYSGLAIVDAVECSPCDVHGLVRGAAMSMASWILQACDRRYMGPRATQMIHLGSYGLRGNVADVRRDLAECDRLTDVMRETYLRRIRQKQPGYDVRALDRLLERDTYLDAQASIALGLADEIA